MKYTLSDAREHIHREVKGGSCKDAPIVDARINQAIMRAMRQQYANGEYGEWCIEVNDGCILLPPEIETAELVTVNDIPREIKVQWFKFISNCRPVSDIDCCGLWLEDLGDGFITDKDIPRPMMLLAFPEIDLNAKVNEKDVVEIYIQGIGEDGNEVFTHKDGVAIRGAHLSIKDNSPQYTKYHDREVRFQRITSLKKSESNWPIWIYGIDDEFDDTMARNGIVPNMYPLVYLSPFETSLSRRRYQLHGWSKNCPAVVRIFGRARYRPVKQAHEPLLIQDLDIILHYVQQIEAESNGKIDVASYHKAQAQERRDTTLGRKMGVQPEPLRIQNDGGWGFGDITNL